MPRNSRDEPLTNSVHLTTDKYNGKSSLWRQVLPRARQATIWLLRRIPVPHRQALFRPVPPSRSAPLPLSSLKSGPAQRLAYPVDRGTAAIPRAMLTNPRRVSILPAGIKRMLYLNRHTKRGDLVFSPR